MAKKFTKTLSLFLVLVFSVLSSVSLMTPAAGARSLPVSQDFRKLQVYPGGMPFGVKFLTEGILVVGLGDIPHNGKTVNPSKTAGLRPHDVILQINGVPMESANQLSDLVKTGNGAPLKILYLREGVRKSTTLTPVYSDTEGRFTTGLYVRDSGAGIGTVTFIIPKTCAFAGLGHGICDGSDGELIPMQRGSVVGVTISGVVRGLAGSPGEVKGYFSSGKTGTLLGNTHCGVFGVFASLPDKIPSAPVSLGLRNEVKEGRAYIYSMLDSDSPRQYEIEISEIRRDSTTNKCFTVKVTDPELIAKTGGIIQGMSGSPIIQNGKLIGAVTHVLINDPTTGYGIFIENMLGQMGDLAS